MNIFLLNHLETVNLIQDTITESLKKSPEFSNIYNGVIYIVGFALFIYLTKETFTLLVKSGREPIEPIKHIITPLFWVALYFAFPAILDLIVSLSSRLGELFLKPKFDEEYVTKVTTLFNDIRLQLLKDKTVWDMVLSSVSFALDKSILLYIVEGLLNIGLVLDEIFIYLFAAYSQIMIEVLKIVAPISLVLSFIPNLKNIFITWLKSFISVNLWFGVAALIFRLINNVSLKYFEYRFNDMDTGHFSISSAYFLGFTFIGLGIFKGIMMFKVPQIVSMFIGSNSSGGMFGAAFAPLMVGMAVAKGAASVGKSVVTSGASGASGGVGSGVGSGGSGKFVGK